MKNFLLTLTRKAMTIAGVCVFTGLAAGALAGVSARANTPMPNVSATAGPTHSPA